MQEYIEKGVLARESGYGVDEDLRILNYAFLLSNKSTVLGRKITDVVVFDTTAKVTR